ncbi:SIR2 family protein [Gillisia sp. M10.2A]|uniref:SIR2 family protein n=1 Tax=Gillisia lutea TaxID=2909668 RepID=A0ABS9EBC0_9FLAO|nr:SIR2 family protein [Gillisia lutea]MCF4100063.1 SIR2 family protein [Gillisia lutea]
MNDNINSIAFSIYSNKGIYALLLGSGISRNSGIPTGWEIVLDLIKKLSVLENENCEPNPDEWFIKKYNQEPDYSTILEKLAATPTERLNILKPYFEPTPEEVEEGLKQPTIAHKQIAKLVQAGYIRIIVTTNFDRLLEKALREIDVEPVVISHPNDIDGVLPLVHSKLVILKLNGDYLDSRFLNTKEELNDYNQKLKDYALRIIDEFGIITCGWSAKWDNGLVNLFKQSSNFRFNSFWTYINKCNKELEELARLRRGKTIQIENADKFFSELYEKINSLELIDKSNPISKEIAIARIKKYVSSEDHRIKFNDLLHDQINPLIKILEKENFSKIQPIQEELQPILLTLRSKLEDFIPILIHATYWSKNYHNNTILNILKRVALPQKLEGHFYRDSVNFQYFPALAIFYSIVITAIKNEKFELLKDCFYLRISDEIKGRDRVFLIEKVNSSTIEKDLFNKIIGQNYKTPISTYLHKILEPMFSEIIYDDEEYDEIFSIAEYLISLNYMFLIKDGFRSNWAPWGEYVWKERHYKKTLLDEFLENAKVEKNNWKPIEAGLFDSSYESYSTTKAKLQEFLKNIHIF